MSNFQSFYSINFQLKFSKRHGSQTLKNYMKKKQRFLNLTIKS